jgi:hypothetical protein
MRPERHFLQLETFEFKTLRKVRMNRSILAAHESAPKRDDLLRIAYALLARKE